MTSALCPVFISWMCHHSTYLILILLIAGSGSTGEKARAGAEGRARSGGRDREGGRVRPEAEMETSLGDTGVSKPGAAVEEDDRPWTEAGPGSSSEPIRSMGSLGGDGHWEPRSSSRCVPIPSGMALCRGIGYDNMRMPNLLGHESRAEAVQQSASWLPLLARDCHPDARIFLCSLFAPICLDRFVSPCKSLCESVRDSCAPVMGCYGYPWPEILRCDQFPSDHLMCISSITNTSIHEGWRRVPQASCRDCELENSSSPKDTLETFCKSDFVVKLRLTRLKFSPVSLSQFSLASNLEVLKHGPMLGGQIRARIELWLERDATCLRNMTRQHPRGGTFLVTGTVQGERLVVKKAFAWLKHDRNLTAAARKWKHHRCKSYI